MSLRSDTLSELARRTIDTLDRGTEARAVAREVAQRYPHATDGDACQAGDDAAATLVAAVRAAGEGGGK